MAKFIYSKGYLNLRKLHFPTPIRQSEKPDNNNLNYVITNMYSVTNERKGGH